MGIFQEHFGTAKLIVRFAKYRVANSAGRYSAVSLKHRNAIRLEYQTYFVLGYNRMEIY